MEKTPNQFIPVYPTDKGFLEAGKSTYINSLFKNKKGYRHYSLLSLEEGRISITVLRLKKKG